MMTAQDNIKSLANALMRLTDAITKAGGSFPLEGAGSITQALKVAHQAQSDHQDWLLSERR